MDRLAERRLRGPRTARERGAENRENCCVDLARIPYDFFKRIRVKQENNSGVKQHFPDAGDLLFEGKKAERMWDKLIPVK